MKILVLNYEYPPLGGGGSIVTKELCSMLASHGNEVDVVTMGYRKLPMFEENEGVSIYRVKCWRSRQRVCHPWEQLSYCINAYRYINKNLNVNKYDFVHCHFIIPTGMIALWLKNKYGINYVLTSHGSDVIGHNNSRFYILYKLITPYWKKILKNASKITAPSPYLVNKIHATSSNVEVCLVPNGIKTADYRSGNKEKSIITLTRLQESKGVQNLIETCAGMDLNGWEINILGDGPYRDTLEKMVCDHRLEGVIHFRGYVEGEERMSYLSHAGCFFSGSRFEAFPLSVLEGTLCGCNIIASDIEPHRLLVGAEHVYKNKDELKSMLFDVVHKEPRVYNYENYKYDWENIYRQYEGLYKEMNDE